MQGRPLWTPEKQEKFLEVLATGASVARAAAEIGAARSTVFGWKKDNPEFAERWDNAVETGTDLMEDEALRRALKGTERPVYQQGVLVGYITEFSDTLMIFQLKARRREKYSERSESKVDMTLNGEDPATVLAARRKAREGGE
jgi:transposase-like protein